MNEDSRVTVELDMPEELYELLIMAPGYIAKEALMNRDFHVSEMCSALQAYLAYQQPELAQEMGGGEKSIRIDNSGVETGVSDVFGIGQEDRSQFETLLERHGLEMPDLPDTENEDDGFTNIDIGGDGGEWSN